MKCFRSFMYIVIALILGFGWSAAAAQEAEKKPLSVGITGSTPADARKSPTSILGSAKMQKLVLELSVGPKSREELERALAGESFTIDDMVNVGLLRMDRGSYYLDFNLLRVTDQKLILGVAKERGRDLARAFLARRDEFEKLTLSHTQPHVEKGELLFILLGCFSLDWDGLALTKQRGYRAGAQRTIDGHSFTPWAKEKGMEISLKGLYWGSHSSDGTFIHTTFGDHDALPRFGLPDMMWNTGADFGAYADLPEGRLAARLLLSKYTADVLADVAAVMLALRKEDLSLDALASRSGIESERLERIVALLEEADYVTRRDGTYAGRVVVLDKDEGSMVRGILSKAREIMVAWHDENYNDMKEALSDLTPLKQGVPFERVYTEVWHFVFGIANRELVEAGFFADPYANGRRHKGFVPFLWASGLDASVP